MVIHLLKRFFLLLFFSTYCTEKRYETTIFNLIIQDYKDRKYALGNIDDTLINYVFEKVLNDYETQKKITYYMKKKTERDKDTMRKLLETDLKVRFYLNELKNENTNKIVDENYINANQRKMKKEIESMDHYKPSYELNFDSFSNIRKSSMSTEKKPLFLFLLVAFTIFAIHVIVTNYEEYI